MLEEAAHSGSGLLLVWVVFVLLLEDREGGFADGFCCMGPSNCDVMCVRSNYTRAVA